MPYLTTPRLILRDYEAGDLASHHALMSDRAVMAFLPDLTCATVAQSRRNLETAMADARLPADARSLWFFRVETRAGEPVGSVGYTVTARAPGGGVAEAGYFIHRALWGRGYTTEAFRAVLAFAFGAGGLHRITAGCNALNAASRAVMVKCGMVHEATRPQHTWHDGRWCDRLEYRLLRTEWQALGLTPGRPDAHLR